MLPSAEIANLLLASVAAGALGTVICVIHSSVTPTERDFYCTDQSINYTSGYLQGKESVPISMAVLVGVSIIVLTVITLESARSFAKSPQQDHVSPADGQYAACVCCGCGDTACATWFVCIIRILLLAGFGLLVNEVFTVTLKKTLGRHRPYFLSACHLVPTVRALCKAGARTSVAACTRDTPEDRKHLLEAIQSFPSGHASHSMYMVVFSTLYLQSRFTFRVGHAAKWLLQCLALLWGCYVCASRISDYRHHWSDVLGGGVMGAAVGFVVSLYLRPS